MNATTQKPDTRNLSLIRVLFDKWEALNARCVAA